MTQEMRENYKKYPPPPLDPRQLDPNMTKMLQMFRSWKGLNFVGSISIVTL